MSIRGQRQRIHGKGDYPVNWTEFATAVKEAASWRCEHCGHPHETATSRVLCDELCAHTVDGKQRVLTVHHLDMNPANCAPYNLVALCQACHLRVQSRVDPHQLRLDGDLREEPQWLRRRLSVMLAGRDRRTDGVRVL